MKFYKFDYDNQLNQYGRTELTLTCCPNIAPDSAWKKLRRWIGHNPRLGEHFRREGNAPRCRSFTPRQVGIIVECIGKPYE